MGTVDFCLPDSRIYGRSIGVNRQCAQCTPAVRKDSYKLIISK